VPIFLEQRNLAPSTINVSLAAVRRLAYEAGDTGLLSPDLAAGIRRVSGAKRRIGNWLTVEQARALLQRPAIDVLAAAGPSHSGPADWVRSPAPKLSSCDTRIFRLGRTIGSSPTLLAKATTFALSRYPCVQNASWTNGLPWLGFPAVRSSGELPVSAKSGATDYTKSDLAHRQSCGCWCRR
jgi:hypothetical protein